MYTRRGFTQHGSIFILLCAIVLSLEETYLGSMVFHVKRLALPGSSPSLQQKIASAKLEFEIRKLFKNDSHFKDFHVKHIREIKRNKILTSHGLFYTVFNLRLQNGTKASINKLYKTLSQGKLGNIPVLLDSLKIVAQNHASIKWPGGNYGLPKPATGCPSKSWKEGYRYHDSENSNNRNYKSNGSHFSGDVGSHGIQQEFCFHIHEKGSEKGPPWPVGQYCLYKKGQRCPIGLEEGWIRWDDENSDIDHPNSMGGQLPEGSYGDNTLIRFCCSTRGNKTSEVILPYGKPFYLIAYGSPECQRVFGFQAISEFIQFDDEDQGNRNAHGLVSPYGPEEDPFNTRIYYCYYQPVKCNSTKDPFCDTEEFEDKIQDKELHAVFFAAGSGVAVVLIGSAALVYTARQLLSATNFCDGRW